MLMMVFLFMKNFNGEDDDVDRVDSFGKVKELDAKEVYTDIYHSSWSLFIFSYLPFHILT